MPILTGDTETFGFSKHFVCGAVCNEKLETTQFNNSEEMRKWIEEYALKQKEKGKNTYIYFHNLEYDFFRIWDIKAENIIIKKKAAPLLVSIGKPKPYLFPIDSYLIFRSSLRAIGNNIGEYKTELSKEIKEKLFNEETKELEEKELETVKEYNKQDCIVLMKGIINIKEELKKEGIKPRRLLSAGQIALTSFKSYLERNKKGHLYLEQKREYGRCMTGFIHPIESHDEILTNGRRGGRIEAIQTGEFEDVYSYDMNAQYPYSTTIMEIPNLRTGTLMEEPLKRMTTKELLEYPGLSKALIHTTKQEIGQIPIRFKGMECYPTEPMTIMGTWANSELKEFEKEGNKIVAIERSLVYNKSDDTVLPDFMKETYQKRLKAGKNSYIYKWIMNYLIGKFCQKNKITSSFFTNVDCQAEWIKEGYVAGIRSGFEILMTKEIGIEKGCAYMPILYALTTAKARELMYNKIKEVGVKNVLYCSTDGLLCKGNQDIHFKEGKEMGEWKYEARGEKCEIKARHSYKLGHNVKLAGVGKAYFTEKDFDQGEISYNRMITLANATNTEELGTMEKKTNYLKTGTDSEEEKQYVNDQKVIIDKKEKEFGWFVRNGYL